MRRALFFFCLIAASAKAERVETALGRIDGSYPWRRYAEGFPAAAYGAATGLGGLWIMLDTRHHNDTERTVGAIAAVTGGILLLDSLSVLFGKSSGERMAAHYREMDKNGDGLFANRDAYARAALVRFAESSRTDRWVRGVLTAVNAAPYFYFYFSNKARYGGALFLGSGLGLIALYRMFIPSAEESAAGLVLAETGGHPTFAWRVPF